MSNFYTDAKRGKDGEGVIDKWISTHLSSYYNDPELDVLPDSEAIDRVFGTPDKFYYAEYKTDFYDTENIAIESIGSINEGVVTIPGWGEVCRSDVVIFYKSKWGKMLWLPTIAIHKNYNKWKQRNPPHTNDSVKDGIHYKSQFFLVEAFNKDTHALHPQFKRDVMEAVQGNEWPNILGYYTVD